MYPDIFEHLQGNACSSTLVQIMLTHERDIPTSMPSTSLPAGFQLVWTLQDIFEVVPIWPSTLITTRHDAAPGTWDIIPLTRGRRHL